MSKTQLTSQDSSERAVRDYAQSNPAVFGRYIGTVARECKRLDAKHGAESDNLDVAFALVDLPAGLPSDDVTAWERKLVRILLGGAA